MENPFKKSSRVPEYNETTENIKKLKADKDKLDFPLGHGSPTDGVGATLHNVIGNSISSIPNIPASMLKGIQIKLAQKKLERIYDKDEEEANKLNDKYNKLLEEAEISGESSKLKEFAAKELGMNVEELMSK